MNCKTLSIAEARLMFRFYAVILAIFLVNFAGPSAAQDVETERSTIGTATLLPDGTLALHLRAEEYDEDGDLVLIGHGYFEYKPGDPDYETILEHVGAIKIGQEKFVSPWPD